jgi:septum formation protein
MEEIILASASPRRKDLLTQIGIPYKVVPSTIEENIDEITGTPEEKVEQLALLKAQDVAQGMDKGFVLGADTVVVLNGIIFGKPKDYDDAFEMLNKLSGKAHNVITGIALVDPENGRYAVTHEITKVKFAQLSKNEIAIYLSKENYGDKAGAYAVQGIGALLVEGIEGCYANVVGLPLMKLRKLFEEFGVHLL